MTPIHDIPWATMTAEEIDRTLAERIHRHETSVLERGDRRPKREGFVMERIAEIENLREADKDAQRGKKMHTVIRNGKEVKIPNRHILRHNARAEEELRKIQLMFLTGEFPKPEYESEVVETACGKKRELLKLHFYPWKIIHHAVMRIAGPYITRTFITDTCACIKGRGLHYGVRRMRKQMRRNPGLNWFWKVDIKKYYQSIPHQVIVAAFGRIFKDKAFMECVRKVLLTCDCMEAIIPELENEIVRNKRHPHWGSPKPNHRKHGLERHRPPYEAQRAREDIHPLLRRCGGLCADQSRGDRGDEAVPRHGVQTWSCSESQRHSRALGKESEP